MTTPLASNFDPPAIPARVLLVPEQDAASDWQYPAAWTEAEREAWEEACGEIIAREKEATGIQDKAAALMASPEMLIEIKRGERDEMRRAVDFTRRLAQGNIGWLKARAQFGDDVRRIDGEEGDVIIMRRMSEAQVEDSIRLKFDVGRAKRSAIRAGDDEATVLTIERAALLAERGTQQDALIANATIPGEPDEKSSAARLRLLMSKHWGLWHRMLVLRDEMIAGWRVTEGKDFAPS